MVFPFGKMGILALSLDYCKNQMRQSFVRALQIVQCYKYMGALFQMYICVDLQGVSHEGHI